jgi:hypothetical protein
MSDEIDPTQTDEVHRIRLSMLRLAAAIVAAIMLGSTYALWFGRIDICDGATGWWFGVVLGSPLVLVALSAWCLIRAPSVGEQVAWLAVMALVILAYLPATYITIIGGSMASC